MDLKRGSEGAEREEPGPGAGAHVASVTDKISSLVLVRPYNWRWFLGSRFVGAVIAAVGGAHVSAVARARDLGDQTSR